MQSVKKYFKYPSVSLGSWPKFKPHGVKDKTARRKATDAEPEPAGRVELVSHGCYVVGNFADCEEPIKLSNDAYALSLSDSLSVRNCRNCAVAVDAKINQITVHNCENVQISFAGVLTNFVIYESKNLVVNVGRSAPCITADHAADIKFNLFADTLAHVKFTHTLCSNLQIVEIGDENDELLATHRVPFQFISQFEGGKLVTVPSGIFDNERF